MSSIREQIIDEVETALDTDRPEGIPAPVRDRVESPATADLPILTFYVLTDSVESMHENADPRKQSRDTGVVTRELRLAVEVLTGSSDVAASKAADPILVWATKAIMGLGHMEERKLLRPPCEQGTEFKYEQGESSFCRATMLVSFHYSTKHDDPESLH